MGRRNPPAFASRSWEPHPETHDNLWLPQLGRGVLASEAEGTTQCPTRHGSTHSKEWSGPKCQQARGRDPGLERRGFRSRNPGQRPPASATARVPAQRTRDAEGQLWSVTVPGHQGETATPTARGGKAPFLLSYNLLRYHHKSFSVFMSELNSKGRSRGDPDLGLQLDTGPPGPRLGGGLSPRGDTAAPPGGPHGFLSAPDLWPSTALHKTGELIW